MAEQIDSSDDQRIAFADWTTSQRELWPLQNLESNSASLNTGQYTEYVGALDIPAFQEASRLALFECEALRAQIVDGDNGPSLRIALSPDWATGFIDFSAEPAPRERALVWMAHELGRAFEPAAELFSWTLIKLGREHHIWCFIVHQIALDGYSRNLVSRRLSELYSSIVGGTTGSTAPPRPLGDLLREDAAYRASPDYAAGRDYWAAQTANPPSAARLTHRPSGGSYLPGRCTAPLTAEATAAARALMARTGASSSALFACLSAVYLHCLTGQSDLFVGLLAAARTNDILRGAPGNVSNTLPLRLRFEPATTLDDLIAQARARLREALTHQRFPLSEIKAALPTLTGELFSIAVNVMKFDYALKFGALRTSSHNLSNGPVDDLTISVFEQKGSDEFEIALNGNIARYSPDELKAHFNRLMGFLRAMCEADSATPIQNADYFIEAKRVAAIGLEPQRPAPRLLASVEQRAPRTARERLMCRIFGDVLGEDDLSNNDNFFAMGGHSLLAARLISRLSAETKTKIPLRAIFENPTPGSLARYLDERELESGAQSSQPMLILFPGGGALTREVVDLRAFLAPDFNVAMVEYPDWRDQWDVFYDFDKYLAFVLAQIQRAAPTPRPLRLVGYSFGGGLAYAMSAQLARLGYRIDMVGLIDSRAPTLQETASTKDPMSARLKQFALRDRLSRGRQIGRFIGIRAKKPVVKTLLKWLGPYLPRNQSSELLFYMAQFINASVPFQGIRDWTSRLAGEERLLRARAVLFRSMDSGDDWPADLGWGDLAPGLEIQPLPGTHLTIISAENLATIRARIVGAPDAAKPTATPAAAPQSKQSAAA